MKFIEKIKIEKILSWMRSYKAPFIGLIIFTAGVVFQSEQFFVDSYPEHMPDNHKLIASFFIALSLEFLIILVTVNYQHDNDMAINIFFLLYLILTLYFLQTFQENMTIGYYVKRAVTSLVIAFIARVYADLLIQKLKEKYSKSNKYKNDNSKIIDLQKKLEIAMNDNKKLFNSLEHKKIECNKLKRENKSNKKQIPINFNYSN